MSTIPIPVIAVATDILSSKYTHPQIDLLFSELGFPGDPPPGSKVVKVKTWFRQLNKVNPEKSLSIFGKTLEEFMEEDAPIYFTNDDKIKLNENRERINSILAKHGLRYEQGGYIRGSGLLTTPTRTLEQILKARDLPTIEIEFNRANEKSESDPESAVTAACAILEAYCKVYIENHPELTLPSRQELLEVWPIVKKHLRMDPSIYQNDDQLRDIVQGFSTIITSIAILRTKKGSAHGRGARSYRLDPRHARLAVSASHTIVTFLIEAEEASKKTNITKSSDE